MFPVAPQTLGGGGPSRNQDKGASLAVSTSGYVLCNFGLSQMQDTPCERNMAISLVDMVL